MGAFVERYLPDRFYLPNNSVQRQNLRWDLFREIVGNLCVHTDFSSGFACFFHVFKDRVVTKNPTRLLPEIPEGELTIQQLSNYTKNPLLVRVFHELHWAEDLGSGTRNILRYAPLYYPGYKIEINSGQQFVFSITYQDENVTVEEKMSSSVDGKMSKGNVQGWNKMLLNEQHPFILLADNGFRDYYKPSDALFDACAAGRVLILSPWPYDAGKRHISRADCVALNNLAEEFCQAMM